MLNMGGFDLNLLLVFEALMRERNVTRAGARLGLSQPSMSNALTRLRRAWNDPLFVRTPVGMEPTPLALRLARPVQEGLAALRLGLEQPETFNPAQAKRRYRLVMSDIAQVIILPVLMEHMQEVAPGIGLDLLPLSRDDYAKALEEDWIDLAIGNLPFLNGAGFYQQRLFEDDYMAVVRAGHVVARQALTLEAYCAMPHLAVVNSLGDRMVEQGLAGLGARRDVVLTVPNFLATATIASASNLMVTLPRTVLRMQKLEDEVAILELPFPMPRANVRQFWHIRHHREPGNQWFRAELAQLMHASFGSVPEPLPPHEDQ
ncbi:MAG: LysR family transcriptional regulator [Pigmentiphaga sp.]